jgi:hypothetical protein
MITKSAILRLRFAGARRIGIENGTLEPQDGETLRASVTSTDATNGHLTASTCIPFNVYTLGAFTYDALTVIDHNHASTSGDNIGP